MQFCFNQFSYSCSPVNKQRRYSPKTLNCLKRHYVAVFIMKLTFRFSSKKRFSFPCSFMRQSPPQKKKYRLLLLRKSCSLNLCSGPESHLSEIQYYWGIFNIKCQCGIFDTGKPKRALTFRVKERMVCVRNMEASKSTNAELYFKIPPPRFILDWPKIIYQICTIHS